LVTDILYCKDDSVEHLKYLNRIQKINVLITSHTSKLKSIGTQPVFRVETNLVTTPTIVRYLCAVQNFGTDYLITPVEQTFTYAIVGTGYMNKPDIVLKREPFTKLTAINNAVKLELIGKNNETLLTQINNLPETEQLIFYNKRKDDLFDESETSDVVKFTNNQTQKVYLVAGVNKNKLSIFGYTKDGKKLSDDNIFIEKPEILRWEQPEFETIFNNITYYKNFYHIVSRPINKFNPNKLSVISVLSSTALSLNTNITTDTFDTVPINDTQSNINKTLNNASNDDIIAECISRIGNILLQTENRNLKSLFQQLQTLQTTDNNIKEKFDELMTLLDTDEYEVIRNILRPLQNEITDVNHFTITNMSNIVSRIKRKRTLQVQQKQQKRLKFEVQEGNESDTSSDENES